MAAPRSAAPSSNPTRVEQCNTPCGYRHVFQFLQLSTHGLQGNNWLGPWCFGQWLSLHQMSPRDLGFDLPSSFLAHCKITQSRCFSLIYKEGPWSPGRQGSAPVAQEMAWLGQQEAPGVARQQQGQPQPKGSTKTAPPPPLHCTVIRKPLHGSWAIRPRGMLQP